MNFQVKGIGSTLKWDPAKAERLFGAVRDDRPLAADQPRRDPAAAPVPVEVAPDTIRVQVANGTGTAGLAKRVDAALAATGFATTRQPVTAPARVPRTVISYDPRWDRSARSLAAALPGAELRAVPGQGADAEGDGGRGFQERAQGAVRGPRAARGDGGAGQRGGVLRVCSRRCSDSGQSSKPSAARCSRSSRIARRRASRWVRRIWASW